jgi:undecaprenyl-diphosphatase
MDGWPGKVVGKGTEAFRGVLAWLGRHETDVLVALLILTASVWAFVRVASGVAAGSTTRFDEWALMALRQPDDPATPIGPSWLRETARDLTALGGVAFLTLLTLAIAGFLWFKRMYGAMGLVLGAALGGLIVSQSLKSFFHRPRPDLVPHLAQVYTSSFPSGHAMLSATIFLTLGALLGRFVHEPILKAYFLIVAGVLTLLVGVSRVYVGVHYPTDVLAGWSAGLAWALTCWLFARWMQHRGLVRGRLS